MIQSHTTSVGWCGCSGGCNCNIAIAFLWCGPQLSKSCICVWERDLLINILGLGHLLKKIN